MNTQELVKKVRQAVIGHEISDAIKEEASELLRMQGESLDALSASYSSVEPASAEYWKEAIKIKKNIEEEIAFLPEDVRRAIYPFVIPSGFFS